VSVMGAGNEENVLNSFTHTLRQRGYYARRS